MARELEVWLFAERLGTLALTDGRLNFRYTLDWLSHTDAVPLSGSLPLQAEPFQARKRILALAKSMATNARGLQSDPSRDFTRHSVVEQIVTLIEQRSALTLRRLMIPSADSEGETEPSV